MTKEVGEDLKTEEKVELGPDGLPKQKDTVLRLANPEGELPLQMIVEPKILSFFFNSPTHSYAHIKMINTTDSPQIFRIKTTDPKTYLAQPSCGYVRSKSTAHVKITAIVTKELKTNDKSQHVAVYSKAVQNIPEVKDENPDRLKRAARFREAYDRVKASEGAFHFLCRHSGEIEGGKENEESNQGGSDPQ